MKLKTNLKNDVGRRILFGVKQPARASGVFPDSWQSCKAWVKLTFVSRQALELWQELTFFALWPGSQLATWQSDRAFRSPARVALYGEKSNHVDHLKPELWQELSRQPSGSHSARFSTAPPQRHPACDQNLPLR